MDILSIVALVCVPLGLKILWPVIFPEERLCYTCGHACRRVPAADKSIETPGGTTMRTRHDGVTDRELRVAIEDLKITIAEEEAAIGEERAYGEDASMTTIRQHEVTIRRLRTELANLQGELDALNQEAEDA